MQIMKLKRPLPGYEVGESLYVDEAPHEEGEVFMISDPDKYQTVAYIPALLKDEWLEKDIPKRWRALIGEEYFTFSYTGYVTDMMEEGDAVDQRCFDFGDYFRTRKQAEDAALKVKELLLSLAEKV